MLLIRPASKSKKKGPPPDALIPALFTGPNPKKRKKTPFWGKLTVVFSKVSQYTPSKYPSVEGLSQLWPGRLDQAV